MGIVDRRYYDTCNIYGYTSSVNPVTHVTSTTRGKIAENVPCRLSVNNYPSVTPIGEIPSVNQMATLYLNPSVNVPSGCEIEVTHNGKQKCLLKAVYLRFSLHIKRFR